MKIRRLALLLLAIGAAGACSQGLPGEITVAAVEDLTGVNAIFGLPIQRGIDLAVKQINEQKALGDGATLKVRYADAGSDTGQAVSLMAGLAGEPNVAAILGPTTSTQAVAADPAAQKVGMPVVASSNTADGITTIGDYIFRTSLPEAAVVPNTVKVVTKAFGLKRAAILYGTDDAFTLSARSIFASALAANGVSVVSEETFKKGDSDFTAALVSVKASTPGAIIIAGFPEEAAKIMIQARAMGIAVPFVGGNSFNTPKLAQLAGSAAEGAISGSAWSLDSTVPASVEFVSAFKTAYGVNPDQFAAQSYTAAWVLALAIKRADSLDHAAIRDALAQTRDWASPLGTFSFDANRDPVHPAVVLVVKNGAFELFQLQS